jgi:hypothetical protein
LRGLFRFILVLTFCVALAKAYTAEAPDSRFLFSDQLQPGMALTGRTCIEGTQITEFSGKILGVERGAFAGGNMIWAELEAPFLGAHGVAAGMSGSPCYVDGRLIGAVGYGFPYSQKPIAGITPIESMLDVLDLTKLDLKLEDETLSSAPAGGVWTLDELKSMARSAKLPGASPLRISLDRLPQTVRAGIDAPPEPDIELTPLVLPLSVSSTEPAVYEPLQRFARRHGLSLAAGGISGATLENGDLPPLAAGSAIGMPLMTGDLTVGGYGTVTYVEDNRLIAFGHPAFGWGTTDIPLSPCAMFAIQPSYSLSFKMGQVALPTGMIRQDRLSGVGGVIGELPRFIPFSVRVKSMDSGRERVFSYQLWDNRLWTPILAETGVAQSIVKSDRISGEATASARYRVGVADSGTIEKTMFYSSLNGPASDLIYSLFDDLAVLKNNPFNGTRLSSLEVEIEVYNKIQQARIVSVTADKDVYRPGDTVRLAVYLQPYRGGRVREEIELQLDRELADGSYELFVGDSESRLSIERERAPGLFTPMNFGQLIEALRKHYVSNALYVVLSRSDEGLTVHGQELPSLPPSLRSTFTTSSERAFIRPISGQFIEESSMAGKYEFVGRSQLTVQVNRSGRR